MSRQFWVGSFRFVAASVLVMLLSSCGGADSQTGLAESQVGDGATNATMVETQVDSQNETEPTPVTEPDTGNAGSSEGDKASSLSDALVYDLNHDVPETLLVGLNEGELRNLFVDVHGPTDDVPTDLNRITIFPASFPTMPDTDIVQYSFFTTAGLEAVSAKVDAEITLHISSPVDDVVAFYESGLAAPSFELVGSADRTDDGRSVHTAEFSTPTSAEGNLKGLVLNFVADETGGTVVFVEFVDALSPAERARASDQIIALESWHGSAPIPPDGEATLTHVSSRFSDVFGTVSHTMRVTHNFTYPGVEGEQLAVTAYDLVDGSSYMFVVQEGDPPPENIIPAVIAAGERFAKFLVSRPDQEPGHSSILTVYFDGQDGPWIDFSAGSVSLLESP